MREKERDYKIICIFWYHYTSLKTYQSDFQNMHIYIYIYHSLAWFQKIKIKKGPVHANSEHGLIRLMQDRQAQLQQLHLKVWPGMLRMVQKQSWWNYSRGHMWCHKWPTNESYRMVQYTLIFVLFCRCSVVPKLLI